MKEPKDKRTKEWKEWKKNFDKENSKGLGDVVEQLTEATGIKKAVETFTNGKDCGCDKRKKVLNKIRFRFNAVRCFNEDMFNRWVNYLESDEYKKNQMTIEQQRNVLFPVYEHLFARTILSQSQIKKGKTLSCCFDGYVNEINKVYETYL